MRDQGCQQCIEMERARRGRHFNGIPVINLGAVVDRRGDFPGRHRHRAARDHAFVQHRGNDRWGCGRAEPDEPDVRCGFYRRHHPTMAGQVGDQHA